MHCCRMACLPVASLLLLTERPSSPRPLALSGTLSRAALSLSLGATTMATPKLSSTSITSLCSSPPVPPPSMPLAPRPPPQALDGAVNHSALAGAEAAAAGNALALLSCCAAATCSVAGLGQARPRLAAAKPSASPLCGRRLPSPAGRIGHRPAPMSSSARFGWKKKKDRTWK